MQYDRKDHFTPEKIELREKRRIKERAQLARTKKEMSPHFAPIFGKCPKCGHNIYDDQYTLEECTTQVITYCKNCNRSFVD